MVKDIMRANETATLNQKELEVLNEYEELLFCRLVLELTTN